ISGRPPFGGGPVNARGSSGGAFVRRGNTRAIFKYTFLLKLNCWSVTFTFCPQLNLPIEGQSINLLPPVKVRPESLITQGVNRLSCRHIIPCAGESGACVFYPRPVWPRSGRRQNNTPGWWWEDTASRIPGTFSGAGKYRFPSEPLPAPVQPAAQTAQNTGKGSRSTIYEAYSKSSPGEGRAFPARHSWRISLLPAFGSLHARSGSAPAAGRSF